MKTLVTKKDSIEKVITLDANYSRRFPDPLNENTLEEHNDIDHYVLLCKANKIPSGISLEPNPRDQKEKIDYGIYKLVKESLEQKDNPSFHLKNKGITILANKVVVESDKKTIHVYLGEYGGIADGGHTYKIILKSQSEGLCPDNQYVKIEIITGISKELGVEVTGGLNTAVQVQEASLLNLEDKFQWVKDLIKDKPYKDDIAFKQNQNRAHDIRDILGLLTVFNIKHFDSKNHPKVAYVSKNACIQLYKKDQESYEMLTPIFKDILELYDFVNYRSCELYNQKKRSEGSKGMAKAMKGVFETRQRGVYRFVFAGKDSQARMYTGTLFPILGAMRFLVKSNPTKNEYCWRFNSFDKVKKFYEDIAGDLIETTYRTSLIYGRKPDPIAKDQNHWENLYNKVALLYLTKYENV